ncbi:MAG: hypothetical protein ACJAYU_002951 [Bradymonadia bacterium]
MAIEFYKPATPISARTSEAEILAEFDVATPELLAARSLQKRVDAKFIATRADLPQLLSLLRPDFHVVLSSGSTWATYETRYFDTSDLALFEAHRRGARPRHKVRIRHYVERNLCFLETKTKDRYSVTTKHRFPRASRNFEFGPDDTAAVLDAIGQTEPLAPSVELVFPRVTLVGVNYSERLTIDLGLNAHSTDGGISFPDVMVVEIKQPRFDARSPGRRALRQMSIRAHRISKYCVSLAAITPRKGYGVFRPTIRELHRKGCA